MRIIRVKNKAMTIEGGIVGRTQPTATPRLPMVAPEWLWIAGVKLLAAAN